MKTELPGGATKMQTLAGGGKVTVLYLDGKAEEILVRQLPITEYEGLVKILDNEIALVELYAGKDSGWSKNLTPASHEEILKTGEMLNMDFFRRWFERKFERMERLVPGSSEKLKQTIFSALPTTLPNSPSPAA